VSLQFKIKQLLISGAVFYYLLNTAKSGFLNKSLISSKSGDFAQRWEDDLIETEFK